MTRIRTVLAALTALALALSGCTVVKGTAGGLPDPFVFSTYGTGTATYADLAAVSDAVSTDTGARLRIITSDTAIGRVGAMRGGIAEMGRLGDEYIYGFEGEYEFAHPDWGPQDLRVLWAPLSPHSLLTRTADGIESPADLKGKKIPKITALPSVNGKMDALLAYGGLTRDDVTEVELAYSQQPEALKNGQIDVLYQQVYGSSLFELESQMDVSWIGLDPEDTEAEERMHAIAPSVNILPFSDAPGQEPGEETYGLIYTLPIVTYADANSDEVVYALVEAMAESFPQYENSTINTPRWNPDDVEVAPKETPFHPGAVRWLEEQGVWTEEAQQKNDELLERGEALQAAWDEFLATDPDPDDMEQLWLDWKAEHVPEQ